MFKIGAAVLALVTVLMFTVVFHRETIPSGYVGVKVYLYGDEKGVGDQEVGVGRYWLTWNEDIYPFPTTTRTDKWDASTDRTIPFQDKDGTKLQGQVGISYRVDRDKVVTIFQKFRKGIEEISDDYMYLNVKNLLNNAGGKLAVDEIYGTKKEELLKQVEDQLREKMEPIGIIVEQLYWSGDIGLPDHILTALNEKISANQEAMKKEIQIKTSKSQAEANRELAASVTKELLDLRRLENEKAAIEKWNGTLPTFMGGQTPTPFLNVTDMGKPTTFGGTP